MMDTAERELLTQTVRDALADAGDSSNVSDVDTVLDELGWRDMLGAEPDDAIAIVFEQIGRANAAASLLDDVVMYALGLTPTRDIAVLHPPSGAWIVPEQADGLTGGLATARVRDARELLVARAHGIVMAATSTATVVPIGGIDPSAALQRVHVAFDAQVQGTPQQGAPQHGTGVWDDAVALARRALAHQIAGAARTMLELARLHALERVQFGRPIASFQAVRHRLAEALVAVEALDAVLLAAADEPGYETAALAKAVAGRTARAVATHAQQVLAGIGFTTDHPFHRYLKRTIALEGLYGSVDAVTLEIGHRILREGRVPTLVDL